jgi:hypothetical protein
MDATTTNLLNAIDRVLDEPDPETPERRAETQRLLELLCGAYLESDADDRAAIRASIARRQDGNFWVMYEFARHMAGRVTGPDSVPALRLALAAISIEDCALDYRETCQIVSDLYAEAERVGIDAQPMFEAVAAMSTDSRTTGGCDSVANILRQSGPRPTATNQDG